MLIDPAAAATGAAKTQNTSTEWVLPSRLNGGTRLQPQQQQQQEPRMSGVRLQRESGCLMDVDADMG